MKKQNKTKQNQKQKQKQKTKTKTKNKTKQTSRNVRGRYAHVENFKESTREVRLCEKKSKKVLDFVLNQQLPMIRNLYWCMLLSRILKV